MISIQKNLVERAAYTTTKVTVEQKRSGLFAPKIKPDPIRDSLKSLEQIREMGDSIPAALNMVTTGADALKHATILANLAKTTNPAAELTNILLSRYITGPSFGSSRLKSVTIETKPLKSHIEVGILRISNDKTHMEGIWNVDKASIEANELTIQAPKRTVFQEVKSSGMRVLLSAAALFSSAFLSTNPALAFVPSVDFQKGQSITTQELFEPAELNANELFIRIGDGLFSGSQIRAKALEMIVEKNLKIETLAEVFKSEMKDQKVGIGLGSLFAEASKGDVPFNFLSPKLAAIPTFSISSAETLIHSFDRAAELIGQHKFYLKVGELLHTVSAEIGLKPVGYSVPSIVEVLKAERIMKEDLKTFEQTKKHTFNPCVGELLAAANSVNDLAEIRAKFAAQRLAEGAELQKVQEEVDEIKKEDFDKVSNLRKKMIDSQKKVALKAREIAQKQSTIEKPETLEKSKLQGKLVQCLYVQELDNEVQKASLEQIAAMNEYKRFSEKLDPKVKGIYDKIMDPIGDFCHVCNDIWQRSAELGDMYQHLDDGLTDEFTRQDIKSDIVNRAISEKRNNWLELAETALHGLEIAGIASSAKVMANATKEMRALSEMQVIETRVVPDAERKGFSGHRGFELKNLDIHEIGLQKTRNTATVINGRTYTGHALDQMQNRGLQSQVIENAIKTGNKITSTIDAQCWEFHDVVNNIKVVVMKDTGNVRTVMFGARK